MKKVIAMFLSVIMICSLVPTAFAANINVEVTDDYVDELIDESTYIVDERGLTHTPYEPLAEENIPVEYPGQQSVSDDAEDRIMPQATNAVYGPYTALETMDDSKMQVVVNGLKNSGALDVVKYAGYNCYKFVYNGNTVHVTCDTFFRQQKATPTRSVSSDVTSAINSRNTDPIYTTIIRSAKYTYNGMTVYHWNFARVSVQAFHAKNNSEVVMSVHVNQAYDFDAYTYSLQDITTSRLKIAPTMAIRVTNSGNGIYFDSYEFRGLGEDTSSSLSLGKIVSVGYTATKMVGAISSSALSVGTIYNLFNLTMDLAKSTSSARKSYLTDIKPLSSSSKYLYKFETPVPYPIRVNGDYATMELGITGTLTSSTKYNAYYGWTVS